MQRQTLERRFSRSVLVLLGAFLVLAVPLFSRAQSSTQPASHLPRQWSNAVAALGERIANLAGGGKPVSLEVENISSLGRSDVDPIHEALEADLTRRGFHVEQDSSRQVHLVVTLSEGVEGYVWVAQVRNGSEQRTAMVSVEKADETREDAKKEAVLLEKKLVWRQPGKFLDFAVATTPEGSLPELVVLEPERFAYYRSRDATQWAFSQAIPILRSSVWSLELRDLRGFIDNGSGVTFLPNIMCTQTLDPSKVHCVAENQRLAFPWMGIRVQGHEDSETIELSETCDGDTVVLSTGDGDWTQTDQIQGYLAGSADRDIHRSGAPIPTDGPVISFARDAKGSGARTIVRNVKTGDYEGYVITANCGH